MIVCVALTKNYTQIVYLIDSENSQILGAMNMLYSYPFKIKDIKFLPFSKTEFLTCGVQHMSLWNFKGGILNFRELPIQNVKNGPVQYTDNDDYVNLDAVDTPYNDGQPESKNQLRITFLAIIILMDEFIVTAGDDGYVRIHSSIH
jgi:hypothetical protein